MIEYVYHYCSVENFYSIIKNKTLRLTDIGKSNDYMERKWLQRFILETALEEYEARPFPFAFAYEEREYSKRDAVERFINYELTRFSQHWYDDFITYAICFSEQDDSLSQWRGYADDGYGVCIGFRTDAIGEKLMKNHETGGTDHTFRFDPIRYTQQEQKALIRPYIREIFRILDDLLRERTKPVGGIIKLFRAINGESAFCKNPAFREEREWRLAVNFPIPTQNASEKFAQRAEAVAQNDLFSRIQTVVVDKALKSFVELKLTTIGMDALTSVRLGPKCGITPTDAKLFLMSEGVFLPNEILPSAATYR